MYSKGSVIFHEGNYRNGTKEGEWVVFHDNGQLEKKGIYKNRKAVGEWVSYWGNGQLRWKGVRLNGAREGLWESYDENGMKTKYAGLYKNGVKVSE